MDAQPSRVRRVELRCSNVERSAEFYAAIVGLDIRALEAERAELGFGDEPATLVLLAAERPGPAPREAAGLFHSAFRYSERAALATALIRLDTAPGVGLTGASDHGVSEALYLDDPDGLGIELYWDRPRDQWPEPEPGERVHMYTAALDFGGLAALATADPGGGIDLGHVHLKVADVEAAATFWQQEAGMDLMASFGPQAGFLSYEDYHHHIGANAWHSAGAALEPADGAGLERVVLVAGPEHGPGELLTPDGVRIGFEA